MNPASHYLVCQDREIHYTEWGGGNAETVVAWHGLARNGRDMDDLARSLAARYRVVCPDAIGRGLSEWSTRPEKEYCFAFYSDIALALLDQLGVERLHWVGTSMGGALGIRLAAGPLRDRMRRLVLNDMGPTVPLTAMERIATYAGNPPRFGRVSELEAYFRTIYQSLGRLSDGQWRHLTETSLRRLPEGGVTPHYDPNVVMQFTQHPRDYEQWEAYDAVAIPTLCLRGENSDLLLPETADEMRRRGPRAVVVEVPGCGHAPALNVAEQIGLVERFLSADAP